MTEITELTFKERLQVKYFKNPITYDLAIILVAIVIEFFLKKLMVANDIKLLPVLDGIKDKTYYSSLISTMVSLSGFIIAALTIMITVKASLKARGYSDSTNALDYLFTTNIYFQLLSVFKKTIIEFIILIVITHISWLCLSSVNPLIVFKILCGVTFAMCTALSRSLYIFFRTLSLENMKKEVRKTETTDEKQTRLLQEILDKLSEKDR